jgi:LysM repeat protein
VPGRNPLAERGDGLESSGQPYRQKSLFDAPLARGSSATIDDNGVDKPKEGDDDLGELTAERVGVEEEEGTEPVGAPQNLEQGKDELAARGGDAKQDGGDAKSGEGGGQVGPAAPRAPGEGETVELAPEVTAAMQSAADDARAGQAEAEAQAAAFNDEMKARRDAFEAEQEAVIIEKLRTMSSADKRSMLIEMGWDKKAVKKLKDRELDAIIEGKFAEEARRTKILGMTPEELAALSPEQKIQFLVDLGIDRNDLKKIGPAKACKAFDDVMRVAHVPGQHKVKIKIKGGLLNKKSWEVSVKVDADGNPEITAQKKKGFLSKLWGWVKALIPIILTVLGPVTGGISLIVLAVYQAAIAIQTGDWLGALVAIAGAVVGVGVFAAVTNFAKGAYGTAIAFAKVATIANKVRQAAQVAQAAMLAAKAKNAGSLLGALAAGAATFATFASNAAGKFADTMTRWSQRLERWAAIVNGGTKVVKGIQTGDPIGALGGAFETASAWAGPKTADGKRYQRYANITSLVGAGKKALDSKPPDYAAVAEAALGIAAQMKDDRRYDDAARIVGAANRLKQAFMLRDSNPAALAQAAIDLASAIQVARYDADHEEKKDAEGNPIADPARQAIIDRYTRASNVVKAVDSLAKALNKRPRPDYLAGLDAATQLIAELTDNKQLDAAALITKQLGLWTAAIKTKDDAKIFDAAMQLGAAINGLTDVIRAEREEARRAALAKGETLPAEEEPLPSNPVIVDLTPGEAPVESLPVGSGPGDVDLTPGTAPAAPTTGSPPTTRYTGRENTPNANYTVFSGDSLSWIAERFETTVATLRELNPQLKADRIYEGQRLYVPGADVTPTGTVTTTERYSIDPKVIADANRAQLVTITRRFIRVNHDRVKAWLGEGSLGAAFYTAVRYFDRDLTAV